MLIYFTTDDQLSNSTKQKIAVEVQEEPASWIWAGRRTVQPNEWVLCAHSVDGRLTKWDWLFVDRVFAVPRSDPSLPR